MMRSFLILSLGFLLIQLASSQTTDHGGRMEDNEDKADLTDKTDQGTNPVAAEDCSLIQDIRTVIKIGYKEIFVNNEANLNPSSLSFMFKSQGKPKDLFKTSDGKTGLCVKASQSLLLWITDDRGTKLKEIDVKEELKKKKEDIEGKSVLINGIVPCGVYNVTLRAVMQNGRNLSSGTTFGPYHQELEEDDIRRLKISEKVQEKPNVNQNQTETDDIIFSEDEQGVRVSWDKVCGQSMAIYVKNTTHPIRRLNVTGLEAKEVIIEELDPCQVIDKKSMFAETFLANNYINGDTYYQHANAKENIVIGPGANTFKKVSRRRTQFFLEDYKHDVNEDALFDPADVKPSKECLDMENYTIIIKEDKEDGGNERRLQFNSSTMDISAQQLMSDLKPCEDYQITVNVSYRLKEKSVKQQLNIYDQKLTTNSNGAFSTHGRVSVDERVVGEQKRAFIRLEDEPCGFSYTINMRPDDSTQVTRITPQQFTAGELPVQDLRGIMACTKYELSIVEEAGSSYTWDNNGAFVTPHLIIKPDPKDKVRAEFRLENYENCDMSEFIVECRLIGSDKTLNPEQSLNVIKSIPCRDANQDCVGNSLTEGSSNYECRARVNLNDNSSSPWTNWIKVNDARQPRELDWEDGSKEDEDDDYATVPIIIAGILFIFFIAGMANFIHKRNEKRKQDLKMFELTPRPVTAGTNYSRISTQSRALLEERDKSKMAEQQESNEVEAEPEVIVQPTDIKESEVDIHDFNTLLNSDEEGLPVPSVTILIESVSSSNQTIDKEMTDADEFGRVEIDGHAASSVGNTDAPEDVVVGVMLDKSVKVEMEKEDGLDGPSAKNQQSTPLESEIL